MSFLSYNKKTPSFNQKYLTPNHYSTQYYNTLWLQNEFIVHNVHLRIGEICEIWQTSAVITLKSLEKYGRTTFF